MKPLRFYTAMIAARTSYYTLKLMGRNASHLPGVIAVRLCPDVLRYLEISDNFIAITGTNGKTSTTNMILSFLEYKGVDFVANQAGSNIQGGIISSLLRSTSFFGKNKKDLAVLEIDERASLHIFPYIQPKIIAITNLFRDSYSRNAHVGYIVETLETSIPKSSLLILNADDMITSQIAKDNKRKYFSIAPLEKETEVKDSIIQDTPYCLFCHHPLHYDFQRYHHIGKFHCEYCGFHNEPADYEIVSIHDGIMALKENNQLFEYKNSSDNITDTYNKLTAISVLREMGYRHDEIKLYFDRAKIVESRFDEQKAGNKRFVTMLAKDQNPVANSRVFDFIRQQDKWGKIVIVMMTEAHTYSEEVQFAENTAWLYDANFEYLNTDFIERIYCCGSRAYDYEARLLLAGINENKIIPVFEKPDLDEDFDTLIILHSTKNIDFAFKYREALMRKEQDHES